MSLIFRKHKPFENLKKYELREHKRCELVLNKTLKQDSNPRGKAQIKSQNQSFGGVVSLVQPGSHFSSLA